MIFIRQHWVVFVVALILAGTVGGSLWYGAHAVPNFSGIYKEFADDQVFYLARAREVLDGHLFLSNPYIFEHKEGPPMQFWMPDYLLAKPLAALGISPEVGYLAYLGPFVFILFLLTYFIIFESSRSRLFGVTGSLFLTAGIFAQALVRIPSPLFDFIFFDLLLLFLLLYLRTQKNRYIAGSTLCFGLLFYLYPYHWTYWAVTLALTSVLYFLFLPGTEYRKIAAVLAGGFLLGVQYFYSVWQASQLPFYAETMQRVGLVYSHFPSGYQTVLFGLGTLLVFGFCFWRRIIKVDAISLLLLSGTIAGIVVTNQHIFTGQNMWFSNHYFQQSVTFFVFSVLYCLAAFVKQLTSGMRKQVIAVVVFIMVALAYGNVAYGNIVAVVQSAFAPTARDAYEQHYAPIFAWLSANTNKEEVVFANERLSELIPVYTGDNVYYSIYAELSFMSNQEVYERYIINNFWDAYTPEYLLAHESKIFGLGYISAAKHAMSENVVRKLLHLPPLPVELLPAPVSAPFIELVKTMQQKDFGTQLKKYRADYLVWDSTKDTQWKLGSYSFLHKEFESEGIVVYKIL